MAVTCFSICAEIHFQHVALIIPFQHSRFAMRQARKMLAFVIQCALPVPIPSTNRLKHPCRSEHDVQTTDGHGVRSDFEEVSHFPHPLTCLCRMSLESVVEQRLFGLLLAVDSGWASSTEDPPGNDHHNHAFRPCNLLLHLQQKVAINLSLSHFRMTLF
jgi:hypothetical protein